MPGRPLRRGALAVSPELDIAFTAIEIIERDAARDARSRRTYPDLAGSSDPAVAAALARIAAPRPAIAGLAMDRSLVMGIVNVTPDSFSDGGSHADTAAAIAHGACGSRPRGPTSSTSAAS